MNNIRLFETLIAFICLSYVCIKESYEITNNFSMFSFYSLFYRNKKYEIFLKRF